MTTLLITILFGCGEKEEETDTALTEEVEEAVEETPEEAEDTAASEEE